MISMSSTLVHMLNVMFLISCFCNFNIEMPDNQIVPKVITGIGIVIVSYIAMFIAAAKRGGVSELIFDYSTVAGSNAPKPHQMSETESLFDYKVRESYVDDKNILV